MRSSRTRLSVAVFLMSCLGVLGTPVARGAPAGDGFNASDAQWASRFSLDLAPALATATQAARAGGQSAEGFTIEEATDPLLLAWSLALQPYYFQYRKAGGSLG